MRNKREIILMVVLLSTLGLYLGSNFYPIPLFGSLLYKYRLIQPRVAGQVKHVEKEPPLAGENKIWNLQVVTHADGLYFAKFDYFYRGDAFTPYLEASAPSEQNMYRLASSPKIKAERGPHTAEVEIPRSFLHRDHYTTQKVKVWMSSITKMLATAELDYAIDWPDDFEYSLRKSLANEPLDVLHKQAVEYNDVGTEDALKTAKRISEQILLRDSNFVPAYVELARTTLMTNWGAEGLQQVEKMLKTAQDIDPKHADTKIFLGFVYAHQQRFSEAEAKFTEVRNLGPVTDPWLWTDWGELFLMQKQIDSALDMYMRAVESKRSFDTYDRAILRAYEHVFPILESKKQFEKMDALYERRNADFREKPCFLAEYAWFRLTRFADYQAGIDNAKKALNAGCDKAGVRNTLGMAHYMAWSFLDGDESRTALVQARVFLPEGTRLFYELATSDQTGKIIPELIANGSSLNVQDNNKFNALAYALMERDTDAARRLVRFGAKFDELVGDEQYPVAVIAFMARDIDTIALMQEVGVNFSDIKYKGADLVYLAESMHIKEIIDIVKKNSGRRI